MARSIAQQGETVRLAVFSGGLSATSSAAFVLYDANGIVRTLTAYERLVIDTLAFEATVASPTIAVYVLNAAVGASSATQANTIATFGSNDVVGQQITFDQEGVNCSQGITPSALAASGTPAVNITGTGRIINAGTQGVRPNWRESLNGTSPA